MASSSSSSSSSSSAGPGTSDGSGSATNATPADCCYAIVLPSDSVEALSTESLRSALEKGPDDVRIVAMKHILRGLINGETASLAPLLMHVIRFVVPSKSKPLKRLFLLFLEECPKSTTEGKLLPEMILVCNAVRSDLLHPNEYVRGATLRTICKLRHEELLEPLITSVRQCLEHRHPYVRKNAVLAVYAVYTKHKHLIPNAPQLIYDMIVNETDMACRRDAFIVLQNTAPELAITYLASVVSIIPTFDDNLLLAIIEIVRKEVRNNPVDRKRYIKLLFALLKAPDSSVKFEAASSLMMLTSNTVAVKACLQCYIQLLNTSVSNNVKIIVLERIVELVELQDRHDDDLALELLRCISAPDLEVRRQCCRIVLELLSPRNVDQVVAYLRKELTKNSDLDLDSSAEYRQLVIQSIHACAVRFPICLESSLFALLDLVTDSCYASAVEVVSFVREAMARFPDYAPRIIERLVSCVCFLKSGKVMRGILWILGEHTNPENAFPVLNAIKAALGDVVINHAALAATAPSSGGVSASAPDSSHPAGFQLDAHAKKNLGFAPLTLNPPSLGFAGGPSAAQMLSSVGGPGNLSIFSPGPPSASSVAPISAAGVSVFVNRVLPDGTYAMQTALSPGAAPIPERSRRPPLQALLQNSDYFSAAVLATCLTKMALRLRVQEAGDAARANEFAAEALRIMACLLQVGLNHNMDEDTCHRIEQCINTLCSAQVPESIQAAYLKLCRDSFAKYIENQAINPFLAERIAKSKKKRAQFGIDEPVQFSLLKTHNSSEQADEYEIDLLRATSSSDPMRSSTGRSSLDNKLDKIMQLTGFSDPVYAEAYVNVSQFDIILDILVVNQTNTVMQNLTIEFATLGDLKLVERPQPIALGPYSYHTRKIHIKVSSTETGVIFGNIVYDVGALDARCVILNDIYIDIMDYIHPAVCSEAKFRSMWIEFEWENKVNVNTSITDLHEFLHHVLKCTNMACLTPETALECVPGGVIAANLYARSVFGEDALANVCVEKLSPDSPITGHIRIRSKTQGIALSLGDKITHSQKRFISSGGVNTSKSGANNGSNLPSPTAAGKASLPSESNTPPILQKPLAA